jgi:hypothetical protein
MQMKDDDMMQRDVPYLSEDQIEQDVSSLLADFAQARRVIIEPPIPIDDIVEKHLKLRLEFNDLARMFKIPCGPEGNADILGAIFFDERRVVIDESLDSYYNPFKEFDLRYTLACGVGQWRLYRPRSAKDPTQALLCDRLTPTSVVRQRAHHYASCLLMPRNLLIAEWQERFGNKNPHIWKEKSLSPPAVSNDQMAPVFPLFDRQSDDEALDQFLLPFVNKFQVSTARMRSRLRQMGLLHCSPAPTRRRGLDSF